MLCYRRRLFTIVAAPLVPHYSVIMSWRLVHAASRSISVRWPELIIVPGSGSDGRTAASVRRLEYLEASMSVPESTPTSVRSPDTAPVGRSPRRAIVIGGAAALIAIALLSLGGTDDM